MNLHTRAMRPWLVLGLIVGCLASCRGITAAQHPREIDADGDGAPADLDCDDNDPAVAPGLPEVPCDGRDNDCDPSTPDGPAFVRVSPTDLPTFRTVQEAIDAAAPEQEVVVCGVTVREQVVLDRPGLALAGLPQATLDGTGLEGSTVTVTAPDVAIRDLTVRGSTGRLVPLDVDAPLRYGGGICAVEADGQVTLTSVTVTGGDAELGGGVAGLDLALSGCVLEGNTAIDGGGLWIGRAATLTGTTITDNEALEGGGVALAPGATALAEHTEIAQNRAERGGGLRIGAGGAFTGGTLRDNTAAAQGGGVLLDGAGLTAARVVSNHGNLGGGVAGDGVLDRVDVEGNSAWTGGGVYVDGDLASVLGRFVGNEAVSFGGAVAVANGGRFAVDRAPEGVEQPVFEGNTAEWGGAIGVLGSDLSVDGSLLVDNVARNGGAISFRFSQSCLGCVGRVGGSTLQRNVATADGGAVWIDQNLQLEGVTLADNQAAGAGGAAYVSGSPELLLDQVTLRDNTAPANAAIALSVIGTLRVEEGTSWVGNAASDVAIDGFRCEVADGDPAFVCGEGAAACAPIGACVP